MYYHKAYLCIYYLKYINNLNDLEAPEVASGVPEFCNFSTQSPPLPIEKCFDHLELCVHGDLFFLTDILV